MPDSRRTPTRLTSLVGKGRTVERARPAHKGRAKGCETCEDAAVRTLRGRQNPFLFPCWKKNGFWNPKKKGLPCGLSGSKWESGGPSLRPRRGPAPSTGDSAGGTGRSRGPIRSFFAACAGGRRDAVALPDVTSIVGRSNRRPRGVHPIGGPRPPCAWSFQGVDCQGGGNRNPPP